MARNTNNKKQKANKKNKQSIRAVKISILGLFIFLLCVAYVVRFDTDTFIDDSLKSLFGGIIIGIAIASILGFYRSCKNEK